MFTLSVKTDNAAFEDAPQEELARILRDVARRVENGDSEGQIFDANGNRVGMFLIVTESD